MPKIVDYEKRKDEIVREAIHIFVNRGYYNTTLLDISERCGMGRTTVYNYFKNKDEILRYAVSQSTQMLRGDLKNIIERQDLFIIEKIKLVIARLVLEYPRNNRFVALRDLWTIHKMGDNEVAIRMHEYIQELRNVFKDLLQEGIKSREIKPVDKDKMTNTLYAIIESFVLHFSYNKDIVLSEQLDTVNILIDGLKA